MYKHTFKRLTIGVLVVGIMGCSGNSCEDLNKQYLKALANVSKGIESGDSELAVESGMNVDSIMLKALEQECNLESWSYTE